MQIEDDTLNFFGMWKVSNFDLDESIKDQIIISGMGGSGIGGQILSAISDLDGFAKIDYWNNYNLPKWADENCTCRRSYNGISSFKDNKGFRFACNI